MAEESSKCGLGTGIIIGVMLTVVCCVMPLWDAFNTGAYSNLVGVDVVSYRCYDKGCSFLVERDDKSREWMWIDRLVKKVGR